MIISIIAISLAELAKTSWTVTTMLQGQGGVQLRLAAAMEAFSQDAQLAAAPLQSCGPPVCSTAYTQDLQSGGSDQRATMLFMVPAIDGGGEVVPSAFDVIIYDFDAGTGLLQRIVEAHAASSRAEENHPVARDVTQITYTLDSPTFPKAVTMDLYMQQREQAWTFTAVQTFHVQFRNAG